MKPLTAFSNIIGVWRLDNQNILIEYRIFLNVIIWITLFYCSWPADQDSKPKDYLNKGGRVTVFTTKPETPLVHAVEPLASYLEKLNVKTIIKVDSHFLDDVTFALEKTPIKDRVKLFKKKF